MAYAAIEINDLDSRGLVLDEDPYHLAPEAWSMAHNIRFRDGDAVQLDGYTTVFDPPSVAPHFAMHVSDITQAWWIYTSLTQAYVYDGTTHTEITRASADYNAADTAAWNGTIFGGIPILNNGTDPPQFWADYSPATPLDDLVDWPAGWSTHVLRSLGPFLIAIRPTKAGVTYPHTVNWSHSADPGTLPDSWDVSDPTRDAGEFNLPDVESGILMDGLPLRGSMILYKESSTWLMRIVGGFSIMDLFPLYDTSGILCPRCVALTPNGASHFVVTQDDIIVHNGQGEPQSVVEKRVRKTLFNSMDTQHYVNSFVFANPQQKEMWFCYPEAGNEHPNKALIWNALTGAISTADCAFRNASVGAIELGSSDTWDGDTQAWDDDTSPWSLSLRRKIVLCDPTNTKFYLMDVGTERNGVAFTSTVQRLGLGLVGRKRSGEPIVDFVKQKSVRRMWIKAKGGPISVRLGFQELPDGPVTWSAAQSFNPDAQRYLDFTGSGKAVAVEFTASSVPWALSGYKPEIAIRGNF